MQQPLVSIICPTFNHELYIARALEGFLSQRISFQYEILIGEDCSTDNTKLICLEYIKKYPNIIKLITSEHNVGTVENFKRTTLAARGKYIALCEGDDYWTDPLKLQKQVDFLNTNPDYAIVHTNKKVIVDDKIYDDKHININSGFIIEEILISNTICTLTVLVRSDVFKETIKRVANLILNKNWTAPDYAFWLDIASDHKVGYLNDITGVYRFLHESMSHTSNKLKAYTFEKSITDIKEFYYKEYLKKNPSVRSAFKNRFKENIFHKKKRLILDYGFIAHNEWYDLAIINPLFYFYLFFKKGQRFFKGNFKR